MSAKRYEIRIGQAFKTAWNGFLKGPEVYVITMLGILAGIYVLSRVPVLGGLFTFVITGLSLPAFIVLAEEGRRKGKVVFADLLLLVPYSPQFLMVFLLKSILISLGFMLLVIPGIYLFVVYLFAELLVFLEKKSFWEAMESSRALVRGHWMPVFSLAIVYFLTILTGAMFLGIGILLTGPIAALLLHAVYTDIRRQEPEVLPPLN